jgi:DNA-binding GntR family transcriptional regulator
MKPLSRLSGRKSLADQAYESLREAIITLEYAPGQMIYENEVAQSLGMSRTPLREAFRALGHEGLVEVLPQRGVRVALISEREVEHARFVRASLEISAFKQLVRAWDAESVTYQDLDAAIREILRKQRLAQQQHDVSAFLKLDEAFHYTLLQASGNDLLVSVVYQMRGHINRLRYLMLKELSRIDELIEEHQAIYDAILRRDEAACEQVLSRHLSKLNVEFPAIKQLFPDYFTD